MTVQPFDFSVDLLRNLLWEYNEAARLEALLTLKQNWYVTNHTEFWGDWQRDVFDLTTANDFGLSVWAVILNVPLVVAADPDPPDKPIFGFGSALAGNDRVNFENGNFAATASGFGLTTEQKRLVLRLRYFQLVTRGAAPEINAFMAQLFADSGAVYVADLGDMKARYVFNFPLTSALELVFTSYDLLPRPAGVFVDYIVFNGANRFGFSRNRLNFDNGNFTAA